VRRSASDREIEVERLEGRWAVVRLDAAAPLPEWASAAPHGGAFVSITRTADELSIVANEAAVPTDARAERGFVLLRVRGPIAFDEIGILARLTTALASAAVSVFALSTFDTDYLLVREECAETAVRALEAEGVVVRPG